MFTKETILAELTGHLNDYKGSTINDMYSQLFYHTPYITDFKKAAEELANYKSSYSVDGVFGAFADIKHWMPEVKWKNPDPFEVADQLAVTLSDFYLGEILNISHLSADDELTDKTIKIYQDAAAKVAQDKNIRF